MLDDNYWFSQAKLIALKSNCDKRKVGCVLVNTTDCFRVSGWNHHDGDCTCNTLLDPSVKHAEMHVLEQLESHTWSGELVAYVTYAPCDNCRLALKEAGIEDVRVLEERSVAKTVKRRTAKYGEIKDFAATAQALKAAMQKSSNWQHLPDEHKECLEMIQHKIARLLEGDHNHKDSWLDIQGYAKILLDTI